MKTKPFPMLWAALTAAAMLSVVSLRAAGAADAADGKDRAHLPMPNTTRAALITYDAKSPDTKYPPIAQLRPPKGAPNVLVVLIDDAGFGSSSAFGGPCATPKTCCASARLSSLTCRRESPCLVNPDA